MKNIIPLILLFFFIKINAQTVGQGVTDIDGNVYNTVIIGTQEWMSENLRSTKYCNGDIIPINNNNGWIFGSLTVGAWNYLDPQSLHSATDERFYNWYAAADSRNICPCNWHVPSNSEWTILENYLIANGFNYDGTTTGNKIAKAMASQSGGWCLSTNPGAIGNDVLLNNSSGFNAVALGYASSFELDFGCSGEFCASWWTSTEWTETIYHALFKKLNCSDNFLYNFLPGDTNGIKTDGCSIRCVKNTPLDTDSPTKSTINIYPNPTNSKVYFDNSNSNFKYVSIFNYLGQEVEKTSFITTSNSQEIDMSNLSKGVYVLKFNDGETTKSVKVIKQ